MSTREPTTSGESACVGLGACTCASAVERGSTTGGKAGRGSSSSARSVGVSAGLSAGAGCVSSLSWAEAGAAPLSAGKLVLFSVLCAVPVSERTSQRSTSEAPKRQEAVVCDRL
eukprot:3958683-Pleurochrysis_carterae.AAC.1